MIELSLVNCILFGFSLIYIFLWGIVSLTRKGYFQKKIMELE